MPALTQYRTMTNEWQQQHRLFHYTSSAEIVRSILDLGFLLIPNKRHLIRNFLPNDDFSRREPQEFGMTSFTELRVEDARTHREQFGKFGICMSWEWALRHGAQRVIYLDEAGGKVFDAFKWLFRLGRQEVDYISTEKPGGMMLENKAYAGGVGAQVYHAMLTLYEYMEPERNSSQVEWRIVQEIPIYHRASERGRLIQEILEAAHSWKAYAVPFEPNDIEMIVCPSEALERLRTAIPEKFSSVPIYTYSAVTSIKNWLAARKEQLKAVLRRRDRIVYLPVEIPKGSVLFPKAKDGRAVVLPWVAKLWGVALHPNAIKEDAWFDFQYEDLGGEVFELGMPVPEARKLLSYLLEMEHIGWRSPRQQ